ncbi:hypothetical protein AVEN_179914-1 [Araneus ventricosus]|uniref:Uncharacterized protein n=1 Tax=Araneus ventricosus TaxID=182803 RepID=A0A4Y2LC03_ARAVE|nr:hypothetical protein AVEN_179914-1 [Araneus ventricosus]
MENGALFHEDSRKYETYVTRKHHLYKLATQADNKSLIITEATLPIALSVQQLTNWQCERRLRTSRIYSFPPGRNVTWNSLEGSRILVPKRDRVIILVFSRTFIFLPG